MSIHYLQQAVAIRERGEAAALATVIQTKGSTPRKVGAKMIIYPNGDIEGTIGGGCGEAEVIREALNVIETKVPCHYVVDLTSGLLYEDGGICGGTMEIFIERL
ncbi:xanthine/CO dehydrogenase XdhC/CoxF family maturation factor [Evansella vedderi]|uniref:Xanthine/CO dehydrogenase XdhC/CoxF family maturation factor n=1 Tax=Evansella vedderi TaxID=38282 RepID=A0ABT9ZQ97_9BACI|nr:XdhC family protein [Evansella vedderi]MDQ0252897.1 xanthine/CO dehydrogenase XdhC/CoxF family maturation factor [Evansella vedderi]